MKAIEFRTTVDNNTIHLPKNQEHLVERSKSDCIN